MRGSHEKRAPREFVEWLAAHGPVCKPTYAALPGDIKQSVVQALSDAQRCLCVYCGRRLELDRRKRFHIEHFRPQSAYPERAVDLANMFLSCGPESEARKPSETCGHAKENRFDETTCIEPDYPRCTKRFHFQLNGKVTAASEGDASAEAMIDILNLNHRELRTDREEVLYRIDRENLDLSDFIDPDTGSAQSYAHVYCARYGKVIP